MRNCIDAVKMSFPIASCRIFLALISVERSIFKGVSTAFNKCFLSKRSLRSSKAFKYILGFVAATVIFVSFFAFSSFENKGDSDIVQNNAGSIPSVINQYSTNTTENQTNETERNNASLDEKNPINTPEAPPSQVLPSSKPLSIIGSAPFINRTTWKTVAKHAWEYFQLGVDPVTGLPAAGCGFAYFTDWDLGVYVQAVIDAQEIGLIEKEGPWGSKGRLEKVLTFLENRTLTNNSLPFWFYQAIDGNPASHLSNNSGAIADPGRLFAALRNLIDYNYSSQTRIDNIVNRMNSSFILTELDTLVGSNNIYDYYVASGFAAFWSNKTDVPTSIIGNIMSAPQIDVNGGTLPISKISCEPILLSIFDLAQPDPMISQLMRQIYLAHEGWYNATGKYRAFSEGPTIPGTFAYEWVVLPDGRTWVILDEQGSDLNISPIIYSKVAFSFLALYNTAFARNMVIHLESNLPDLWSGYCDGIHENGRQKVDITGSNTNGLIMSASRYAIQSGNWP